MRGIRAYLKDVLRLRVNERKSAVARPWERKFLGYTCTVQRKSRLRIAPESVKRLKQKVRERMRAGRGRSLQRTIEELNPLLRGWINYFQLTQSKGVLDELDQWLRRRFRCLLWRQWRKPRTRARKLRALGLDAERARLSAGNGHGPWWNAGASHMHQAFPARHFTRMGLASLLLEQRRLQDVR
jgi:RNA-directed DNA polymerase